MARKNKNQWPGLRDEHRGFLSPLSGKKWKREARAMARLRFRPEHRRIRADMRASRNRQRNIKGWFGELGQATDEAAQRSQAAYSSAQSQIGDASKQSASYAEQLRQRLAKEGQADAAKRGMQFDPGGSNINAQAQLARIQSANLLQGVTASQGATQQAHLADRKRIGQRASIDARLSEQGRRRSLRSDRRDLARQRGDFMTALRPQAREQDRNFFLGLLAAKDKKAARAFAARESEKDRSFRAQEARKSRRSSSSGKSRSGITNRRQIRAMLRSGTKVGQIKNRRQQRNAVDYLINRGVNPNVARQVVRNLTRR